MIPKNIFMFWKGKTTHLVDICLKRIHNLHPEFNIEVFNTSIEKVDGFDSLSVQHQSDWVRICAIEKYGGIWLDATCFLMKPVTHWVDMNKMQLQGFSAPFANDCIENWAFAAPKNDELVRTWKKVFKNAIESGFEKFKTESFSLLQNHVIFNHMPYLTMHGCYIIASEKTGMKASLKKSCDGPFEYLCKTDFKSSQSIQYLIDNKNTDIPFIKFRGAEHNYLINNTFKLFEFGVTYSHDYNFAFVVLAFLVVLLISIIIIYIH